MTATRKLASVQRDWRERDVRVVLAALVIAVATVATIALFASHLQRTMMTSASTFLAADRQLTAGTGQPIPDTWLAEARERGLATGRMVEFSTMVFGDQGFQLVAVKAVSSDYPLRGDIEWQASPDALREIRQQGPGQGELWVNPRLLRLLEIEPGDTVEVGNLSLQVTGLLLREPDGGFNLAALSPRVMMHADDVAATGVIQDGSRVSFTALFAGEEQTLDAYQNWLEPQLAASHRWRSIRDAEALAGSLEKAEGFLLLGGSLAVLLAAVAVAVASRQYALGQRDVVALLKTLGLTGRGIGRLYFVRLLVWGLAGALGGLLLALPAYWGLAAVLAQMLDQPLGFRLDWTALGPALMTALVALFAFAWPPVYRLRKVPAMRVLRSQPGEGGQYAWLDLLLAVAAIFGLVWWYTGEPGLVVALLGGVAALMLVMGVVGWLLVLTLRKLGGGGGSSWRLALVALYRHRRSSLAQIAVFAMTLMLAATLILVRSSLLEDWQAQLPDDAPNHFLINIAPDDVDEVASFLTARGLSQEAIYPMVRGRLTHINGVPVRQAVTKDEDVNALNRELNLTWMASLPADNRLTAGEWFAPGQREGVSVESELASQLAIGLGDELGFTIGAEVISEPVTSIRTVQWDSMKPNFYMAFPPDSALARMPSTWITSFYLEADQKAAINDFTRRFPTVSVLEVDHIIERIQQIVAQVTQAIEAILALILAAALVVMAAVVSATLQDRQREGALLRTLGGRQRLLVRSTMLEFALLGFLAGLLAVIGAEMALWALQQRMFDGDFRWHWQVVLPFPFISALLLALFGRWQLRPVLTVSPMVLLRRLE
ncbi:MAG: ABC transporter ATP-binding protein [Marinobacter sp.]|nr:ABC transporter ATP-binding protein [Marinobacter sp.]